EIEALREAERLGQLNPHVIESTLKGLDSALASSEFAHEEITVVKDALSEEFEEVMDPEELIPDSTQSIVHDGTLAAIEEE
nr:hypothetical protein [Candidatus Poseidoniaceae archaeon]